MLKRITVECTQCRQKSEILLTTDARIIIFNCPSCWTPVMYFGSRVFVLTENQVDEIRQGGQQGSSLMKILERIVDRKAAVHNSPQVPQAPARSYPMVPAAKSPEPCFMPKTACAVKERDQYITQDDVINLRIELETCKDSLHFIESL